MKINLENHIIELCDDRNFTPFSTDNPVNYNHAYISEDIQERGFQTVSKVGIISRDKLTDETVNSAIICELGGGATTIHNTSYLVYQNNLLICISDKVYSLNLSTFTLNWKMKKDPATCFSIHTWEDDFITHGELELHKFDKYGNTKWYFSARDIFVNDDNKREFRIENNVAIVKDWSGYEYHLAPNGKIIKEIKPST